MTTEAPDVLAERARLVRATRTQLLIDQAATIRSLWPRLARDTLILGILAHAGIAGWRLATVAAGMVLLAAFPVLLRRWRRGGDAELRSFALSLGAQLVSVGAIAVTGGMHSPLLPGIAALAVLPTSMYGCVRHAGPLSALLVGAIALVAAAPAELTGPPFDAPHHVPLLLINFGWAFVVARTVMLRVHAVTTEADRALLALRGERVAEAEARTQRLQQVGARIAHELKNPLAAIKGLVQLVRRGDDAERARRLGPVEDDATRVQTIVNAYLTFSRPVEDAAAPPARGEPTLECLQEERRAETALVMKRLSPRIVGAGSALLIAHLVLLGLAGVPAWALGTVLGAFLLNVTSQLYIGATWIKPGRPPADAERGMVANNLLNQVRTAAMLVLSGGLFSPLLPMVSTALVLATQLETLAIRRSHLLGATLLGWLLLVALLPARMIVDVPTGWHFDALTIVTMMWAVYVLRLVSHEIAVGSDLAAAAVDGMRAERLRDAAAMTFRLRDVASRVAEEMRAPLAAMHATVTDVVKSTPESRAAERLRVVAGEIARIQVIVGDYLSATRPLEDLDPESVDLSVLAGESAAVVAGRAETAHVSIALDTTAACLLADPRRLREALLNVLSNALDATPAGGTVRVTTSSTPDGGATITVIDSGRGMPPELLARLGQSYVTTRAEGTGLGVVLVKGVVAQHGGTVAYASTVGEGTRVTITLPARPPVPA